MILGAVLIILGFLLRRPDFGEGVWWVVVGVGIALLIVGVVSILLSMRQDVELDCPHCGGKVMPRVKSSTSHLYLTTVEKKKKRREKGVKGQEIRNNDGYRKAKPDKNSRVSSCFLGGMLTGQ